MTILKELILRNKVYKGNVMAKDDVLKVQNDLENKV